MATATATRPRGPIPRVQSELDERLFEAQAVAMDCTDFVLHTEADLARAASDGVITIDEARMLARDLKMLEALTREECALLKAIRALVNPIFELVAHLRGQRRTNTQIKGK